MPAASPNISLEACGKLLGAAEHACAASPQMAAPATPNWDALANSFASLSVALTWGGILLAAISVLAAWGFGSYLSWQVKKSARKIAQREAQARVDEWLRDEAPKIIRQSVQRLSSVSQSDAQADAADEIGNEVG